MYIIIAGAGVIGRELIEKFGSAKHDIIFVEKSSEVCDEIHAQYGVETVCGNATRLPVLKSAGISKADVFISTIRKDDVNLAITVIAKHYQLSEIVVLMRHKSYMDAYKTAGATKVLNIAGTLISDIIYQVEKPTVQRVSRLGKGAVEIFIANVPEDGKIVGKNISEIAANKKLPQESIIAGIYEEENGGFKIPRGNTKISGPASLFVITKPELVKKTAKYLTNI